MVSYSELPSLPTLYHVLQLIPTQPSDRIAIREPSCSWRARTKTVGTDHIAIIRGERMRLPPENLFSLYRCKEFIHGPPWLKNRILLLNGFHRLPSSTHCHDSHLVTKTAARARFASAIQTPSQLSHRMDSPRREPSASVSLIVFCREPTTLLSR